jgi:hypothetical protein
MEFPKVPTLPDSPIHGPGQGSRGGPGSCAVSTSVLLHALDKRVHAVQFSDPAQTRLYLNCAAMFIDDNTSAANDFHRWLHLQPTPDIIVRLLEKDAHVWERLLFTSGGLLKLRKCLYYVMYWAFDSEGRATLTPSNEIPSLALTNGRSTETKPIRQFDCTTAHQYLGLWNSPSLSMKPNLEGLQLSPLSLQTVFPSRNFHRHLRSLLSAVSWCNASLLHRVFHLRHSRSISSSSPRGIDGYYLILLSSMVPLLKYNSCSTSLYSWCPTEAPRMKLVLSAPFLPPATQSLSNALALSKARHPAPSVLKATAT